MNRSQRGAGSFRMAVLLALAMAAGGIAAQTRPFVSISPTTTTVNPGATVVVDLGYGRSLTIPPTAIFQLTGSVSWNPAALTLVSAVPLGGADIRTCNILSGRLNFDFAEVDCGTPTAFPSGALCRLTFSAATTQPARTPQPLTLALTSCNDAARGAICKDADRDWVSKPKAERVCDRINGSITVNQVLYASQPVPSSRIALAAPIGGSATATLQVENQGTLDTTITFTGQSAPVSLSPASFLLGGLNTVPVEIRCEPTLPGTIERTITTAVSNDPDRTSASYTVACAAILPPERDVEGLTLAGDGNSIAPVYDASGRYVVFQSRAGNLPGVTPAEPNDNGGSDIFRLDTVTGETLRISVDNLGAKMGAGSMEASVAADGMAVAFVAPEAAAQVLRGESKAQRERRLKGSGHAILLRNVLTGTTQRIGTGMQDGVGSDPVIAPGASAVAYTATNLDPNQGTVGLDQVYLVPLTRQPNGNLDPGQPICVSCLARDDNGMPVGNANGSSSAPALSADGSIVAFETRAKNLVANTPGPCPGATSEVVLRNILTGSIRRVSPPAGIAPGACGLAGSGKPSIDHSGRMIAFESDQGINPGNLAGVSNVYVADAGRMQFQRISESPTGEAGSAAALQPAMSGDGRSVAFVSAAANLDASLGDTSGRAYVHARRLDQSLSQRLSLSVQGVQGNADMRRPALNYTGSWVSFDSAASNLVLADTNVVEDVFQRRLPANVNALYYSGFE